MREYLAELRARGSLTGAAVVAGSVLVITALAFFRVPILPELGAELGMTTVQLGAVTTVFAVGRLIADLPGGHMADRIGAPTLMAVSAFLAMVGSLVIGITPAAAPVFAAAVLLGLGSSITNATGMTYFSILSGSEQRGTAMSVFSAGLLGGQMLGPLAAGVIAGFWGWRAAMLAAGVLAGLTGVVLSRRGSPVTTHGDPVAPVDVGVDSGGRGPTRREMMLLQSVSFTMFFTLGAVPQTLVPVIGAEELGLGAAAIGLALGLGGGARLLGTLIGGRLSDRVSRKVALVPGLVIQGIGVALLALRPTVLSWVVAIVLMSTASFAVSVAATILGDVSAPGRVGANFGRFRFVGDLGLIVGPLLVTALYGGLGREVAFGFVGTLMALVAVTCALLLPETHPRVRSR